MENDQLNPRESLNIIENAIKNAQHEKDGAAYYLVLWGSLIIIFYILNYFFEINAVSHATKSWATLVFPIGGLLSYLHSRKTDKLEVAKPLNDRLFLYCWGGTALCIGAWFLIPTASKIDNYTALIAMVFGLAAFITGGVTRFLPSIVGGIISILLSGIIPLLAFPNHYWAAAIAVAAACLIPGILMYSTQKKNKNA